MGSPEQQSGTATDGVALLVILVGLFVVLLL